MVNNNHKILTAMILAIILLFLSVFILSSCDTVKSQGEMWFDDVRIEGDLGMAGPYGKSVIRRTDGQSVTIMYGSWITGPVAVGTSATAFDVNLLPTITAPRAFFTISGTLNTKAQNSPSLNAGITPNLVRVFGMVNKTTSGGSLEVMRVDGAINSSSAGMRNFHIFSVLPIIQGVATKTITATYSIGDFGIYQSSSSAISAAQAYGVQIQSPSVGEATTERISLYVTSGGMPNEESPSDVGVQISSPTAGKNNIALYIKDASSSSRTQWAIYSMETSRSYFAGSVNDSVGITSTADVTYTLSLFEKQNLFTNQNLANTQFYVLPAAAAGLRYCFYIVNNNALYVVPAAGDQIHHLTSSANDRITDSTVGDSICLVAIDGTYWSPSQEVGTWTDAD